MKPKLISREEMIKIAEGLGLEIKFDSDNPGVNFLNEDGTVSYHKDWDEVSKDLKNWLGIEDD